MDVLHIAMGIHVEFIGSEEVSALRHKGLGIQVRNAQKTDPTQECKVLRGRRKESP